MEFFILLMIATIAAASLAVTASNGTTGQDPVMNMCARWYHQSAIKNNTAYIIGGLETFVWSNYTDDHTKGQPIIGYNNHTIEVPMQQSWDWKINITEKVINETVNPQTGTLPPVLSEGAVFSGPSSDPRIYLFGGTQSPINTSAESYSGPQPGVYTLWSFDPDSLEWGQYDLSSASAGTVSQRPSAGAWSEATDQGLAFYLSGTLNNGSGDNVKAFGNLQTPIGGMVVLNFTESPLTATNASTSNLSNGNARLRGGMTYIPGIGEQGILTLIGGGSTPPGTNTTWGDLVSLETIDVFDVASLTSGDGDGWYQQNTTGSIPEPRADFCVVRISAPDNSSHQIFLYGGQSEDKEFDDIYALSIPQFVWTQIYFNGTSPRWGHTCHLISEREILTIGGLRWTNVTKDCDWEYKGVAIYDAPTGVWGSAYNANKGPYTIPSNVVRAIGGTQNGGATMKEPANGFSSPALATLFNLASNTTIPAPPPGPGPISGGTIAGIVIGVLALVGLVAIALWIWLRYHRKRQEKKLIAEVEANEMKEKDSFPIASGSASMSKHDFTPVELQSPVDEMAVRRELGAQEEVAHEMPTDEK